jgi:hypothetical protein
LQIRYNIFNKNNNYAQRYGMYPINTAQFPIVCVFSI